MKTNIKMRVTPEQLEKICKIVGEGWLYFKSAIYMYIFNDGLIEVSYSKENWNKYNLQEIDADLFIRTDGTCEENQFKDFIQSQNENIDRVNDWTKQFNDVSLKLKKKNEILKKARIKRKNQREELYKLNIKLQKCISFEEHHQVVDELKKDINFRNERIKNIFQISKEQLKEIEQLKVENIEMGKLVNLNKSALDLAVITKDLAMNEIERKNNEIEKLKAVIEYLESKLK